MSLSLTWSQKPRRQVFSWCSSIACVHYRRSGTVTVRRWQCLVMALMGMTLSEIGYVMYVWRWVHNLSWSITNQQSDLCAQQRLGSPGSESLLSAWRNLGSLATHRAYSEDWSDCTRLIWVFSGCTSFLGLVMPRLILCVSIYRIFSFPIRSTRRAIVVTQVVHVRIPVTALKFYIQVFQKFIYRQPLIRKHSYLDHSYPGGSAFIPWLLTPGSLPQVGLEIKI